MTTWIGTQKSLGDMLNSLVELNHDSISAYESALTRIDREDYRVRVRAIVGELRRHIEALKPHVETLTTNVSNTPSPKEIMTKGRVLLASLIGDQALLGALHTTQLGMQEALSAAVAYEGNTAATQSMLQAHLQTAKGHTAWLNEHAHGKPTVPAKDEVDATMKQRTIARTDAGYKDLSSSTDI